MSRLGRRKSDGGGGGRSSSSSGRGGRHRNNNNNKSNNSSNALNNGSKKQKTVDFDRDIVDSDQEDDEEVYDKQKRLDDDDDDVEEEETLDATKVRLARQYLQKLEAGDDDDDGDSDDSDEDGDSDDDKDDEEMEHDRIGAKLQRDRLKREGTLERAVADKVHVSLDRIRTSMPETTGDNDAATSRAAKQQAQDWVDAGIVTLLRGHDLTPTCVALQSSGERAVSASKDHSVLLWDVQEGRKVLTLCPAWKKESASEKEATSRTMGEVLSVACSDDGRYAAVGRRDATVCIYDIRAGNRASTSLVKTFVGHKGPITSLCFRTQSLQLFSGSDDRCIRHYSLNEMMYLETLYGHQFGVTGVDCHRKERPVSVGRDRTARAWKIAEDTHLIFRGGAKVASADCVRVIKEDWFLTGHEDGHLGLWMTEKKRAVATVDFAHGHHDGNVGRGINALASLRGSDLAVTGSCDGYLRLWKVMMGQTLDNRGMEPLDKIPLYGYVNDIAVGPKARFCVVAVGQEPRLGRWNRISGAKNRFGIVRLRSEEDVKADKDDEQEVDEAPPEISQEDNDGCDDSSAEE